MRGGTLPQGLFTKRAAARLLSIARCGRRAPSASFALGKFSLTALLVAASLAMPISWARAAQRAVILEIDGAIGPATSEYVARELHDLAASDTALVILRMNTPGGLDTSMRDIIAAILTSPVPEIGRAHV